ncbi:ParB/RepB/Spo0J family partition protein [Bacteriovoracaceae bacterium]|nr:ParB/RepB/Spo0J family partition protein [Bacteriovoracaceae bacterium]
MSFQEVSIDKIITNNKYLRLDTDVDKLKKSIATVGIINPLIINKNNELLAGGRRFTAMTALGFAKVPVVTIEKSEMEQELISIDENLVRLDLNKVEMEGALNRASEIYDHLHPDMPTMEEELVAEKENPAERLTEKETFLEFTAEKTGLSKKSIKEAIDRDKKSASTVKDARLHGELNASQTNQLIKLDKEDQEKVLDDVIGKSAADIKKLVKKVQQVGSTRALSEIRNEVVLPKEYKNLKVMVNRLSKISAKIILEEMTCEHTGKDKIIEEIMSLKNQMGQLISVMSSGNSYTEEEKEMTESFDDQAVHDQIEEMQDSI